LRRLPRRFAALLRDKSRRYTPSFAASMRLILESFPRSASPDGAYTPAARILLSIYFFIAFCAINRAATNNCTLS
jgi:hypothetical protein